VGKGGSYLNEALMTTQEFKHWFEGFTENMRGEPNKKQWARIRERVSEINEVDYVHPWYFSWYPAKTSTTFPSYTWTDSTGTVTTTNAMYSMGQIDYQQVG